MFQRAPGNPPGQRGIEGLEFRVVKDGRVLQTGSQQRSAAHYQRAVKLVREGGIGAVHKITAGYTRNAMPGFVP